MAPAHDDPGEAGVDEIDGLVQVGPQVADGHGLPRLERHHHAGGALEDEPPARDVAHGLLDLLARLAGNVLPVRSEIDRPLHELDHRPGRGLLGVEVRLEVARQLAPYHLVVGEHPQGDARGLEREAKRGREALVERLGVADIGHDAPPRGVPKARRAAPAMRSAASTPHAVCRPRKPPKALTSSTTQPPPGVSIRSTPVKNSPKCSAAWTARSMTFAGGSAAS